MEIWREIEEYPNYMVSNFGNVKSLKTNKILKQYKNNSGYLTIQLCKNGMVKGFLVHRLVAQAFLPNPNNLPEVNHKDENKTNNIVSNLEYCDHKYNSNWGTIKERMSETHKGMKLTEEHKRKIGEKLTNGRRSKTVIQYDLNGNFIREFPSTNEIQRQLGYSQGHISKCCNGKLKQIYGFKWQFKNG